MCTFLKEQSYLSLRRTYALWTRSASPDYGLGPNTNHDILPMARPNATSDSAERTYGRSCSIAAYRRSVVRQPPFKLCRLTGALTAFALQEKEIGATTHNSTYVHRRPFGAPRATRRCGAPLRHMALRPGWAQGHVTYVRFVM